MAILSNLVTSAAPGVPSVKLRQSAAVPILCQLVTSEDSNVQHSAALHLATLSHSELSLAIRKSGAYEALLALEGTQREQLPARRHDMRRQEAASYARWALRTPAGRNLKNAFQPKSKLQLEQEELEERAHFAAATQIQGRARVRGAKRAS
eukprot:3982428-Pleurochrysis_carterae.AAC.1